jgi:GT2 family glycosyltransferase
MRAESREWDDAPVISVVMPVYNPEREWLDEAIRSVVEQAYERWELCIADDHSSRPYVRKCLDHWTSADPRIRVTFRETNEGIAAASNSALELAQGDLVALLDHDDLFRPHALFLVSEFFRDHPDHDIVYTDEDKLLPDGRRGQPYLKGAYSADLLLSNNYICHLTVARRRLIEEVGGFRSGFEGSQDHDLLLRLVERGIVGHISEVLYTWRQVPGSAALTVDAKRGAYRSGTRAIAEALERRVLPGAVVSAGTPGWYHVRYVLKATPKVSVIIPTRDRVDLLQICLDSIANRTAYSNYEVVIVDNDSRDSATLEYLAGLRNRVLKDPSYFNYARIMNDAVSETDGEYILFLNNDMRVLSDEWMTAMLEHSQRPEVGAVGARLLYPDGRVQHEGIKIGGGIIAGNIDHDDYFGLGKSIHEVSAVTGACMMMRREVFDRVGGFDERLRVAFNDVDLCLRLRKYGYRIIYQPLAELVHHESASRGKLHPMQDEAYFIDKWGTADQLNDPYVSPHIWCFHPLILR